MPTAHHCRARWSRRRSRRTAFKQCGHSSSVGGFFSNRSSARISQLRCISAQQQQLQLHPCFMEIRTQKEREKKNEITSSQSAFVFLELLPKGPRFPLRYITFIWDSLFLWLVLVFFTRVSLMTPDDGIQIQRIQPLRCILTVFLFLLSSTALRKCYWLVHSHVLLTPKPCAAFLCLVVEDVVVDEEEDFVRHHQSYTRAGGGGEGEERFWHRRRTTHSWRFQR